MESLVQDIRFALRSFIRQPGFTVSVVLLLGVGIGANVSIFTLVHEAFLSGLPIEEPDSVVKVFTTDENHPGLLPISFPNYEDLRDQNEVFDELAAFQWLRPNYLSGERPERLFSQVVTPNYFELLGIDAALGRVFTPSDDARGASPVVVVTDAFWRSHLGADPEAVGREILLNGMQFTIVGVTPPGFKGTNVFNGPDLWFPMSMYQAVSPYRDNFDQRPWRMFEMLGRLAPGTAPEEARTALQGIGDRLATEYPNVNEGRGLDLLPIAQASVPPQQREVYVRGGALLMGVVGLLLLIACGNVASLILARSVGRRREIAVRLSLGASRARLVRQLLTESLLLGLLGGGLGLLIAVWGPDLLWRFRPPFFTEQALDLSMDVPVLLFCLAVSVVAGILFGLTPALQASRPQMVPALKGETASAPRRRARLLDLRNALLVAQIALSVLALTGAGLFLRSLKHALDLDPGFDTQELIVMSFDLGAQGFDPSQGRQFHRRLEEQLRALPGVRTSALASNRPLMPGAIYREVVVEGEDRPDGEQGRVVRTNTVGHDYFETVGIEILGGRGFRAQDREDTSNVAVINETMAERLWPERNPLDRRFRVLDPAGDVPFRVIGIAADSKYTSLGEEPQPSFYVSIEQSYVPGVTLHVRTDGRPEALLDTVRRSVQDLDDTLPLSHVYTMQQVIGISLWGQRMAAALLGVFAALGVLLAAMGIYAAMAYSVRERRREIGIRMALGARKRQILELIMRRAMTVAAIGLAVGFVLALSGGRLLSTLLYGIEPTDPLTLLGVALLLAAVAFLASLAGARKGVAIPPAATLRTE
jgi:predicted permease